MSQITERGRPSDIRNFRPQFNAVSERLSAFCNPVFDAV